jgi:hypothetical protein
MGVKADNLAAYLWFDRLENVGASTFYNLMSLQACYSDRFAFLVF